MNISDHTKLLRNYMEFRKYSVNSIENYCSNFSGFLSYFEKEGITHPERINSNMIISFLSRFKEPSTHSGYHSAIKLYYEKIAKIRKKVNPHLIRHCYATHLVEAGTDINLIQKLLGHSSVKTTNIYLHISDSHISKIESPINQIKL